ncbi:MAG: DUF3006 domain-containing protein [Moorellales bacterium]
MLILDRFEGEFAVIEHDGRTFDVRRELLPADAKEGDVLSIVIRVDRKATAERRKKIQALADSLFES